MKQIILFLLLTVLGCKDNNITDNKNFNVDVQIALILRNKQGIDLLDPKNELSFQHSDIQLFAINEKNEKVLVQQNLVQSSDQTPYFIYINETGNPIATAQGFQNSRLFLQLSPQITDTLDIQLKKEGNSLFCQKVFYNSILKWERGKGNMPIEITK